MKWYIKQDRDYSEEDQKIHSYTITTDPKYSGWNTDSGHTGYGLPKELAEWICNKLNESFEEPPFVVIWHNEWRKNEMD